MNCSGVCTFSATLGEQSATIFFNMDSFKINERNFRTLENVRAQNCRETRRLCAHLHNSNGVRAAHNYRLAAVSQEQRLLRDELAKIQETSNSHFGFISRPNRSRRSKQQVDLMTASQAAQTIASHIGRGDRQPSEYVASASGSETSSTLQTVPLELQSCRDAVRDLQLHDVELMGRVPDTTESATPRDARVVTETTRTRRSLLRNSWEEARNARYVRHSAKQWFEQELSAAQVFGSDELSAAMRRFVSLHESAPRSRNGGTNHVK